MEPPSLGNDKGDRIRDLLERARAGDEAARDSLVELIYPELRRLAQILMAGERSTHTLGKTGSALVSLYWLRLQGASKNSLETVEDPEHLMRFSVRNMRQILVDYSRVRRAKKRPSPGKGTDYDSIRSLGSSDKSLQPDTLEINAALTELEQIDPDRAYALELKYYGGLTNEEGAAALGIPVIQFRRRCEYAQAWIKKRIDAGPPAAE